MGCIIWRGSVMILLICEDGFSSLRYIYARFRQIGTSCCRARAIARDHATICFRLLILVMLELCCVSGLEMEMVLLVGMIQLLP